MDMSKVGIREFRAGLAAYLAGTEPVAITRHGQTLGLFIPTPGQNEASQAALQSACATLDRWLLAQAVDPDAVLAEFQALRRAGADVDGAA